MTVRVLWESGNPHVLYHDNKWPWCRWLINAVFYSQISLFFSDSVSYPLSLLGGGLAVYAAGCCAPSWGCTFYAFDRCRYSVPFWPAAAGERSVSPAQRMWDWKESEYFHPVISMGMEKHTCKCTAGVSVFCLSPPPSLYSPSVCSCDLWH